MTYPVDGVIHYFKELRSVFNCFSNNWSALSKDCGQLLNILRELTLLMMPSISFVP